MLKVVAYVLVVTNVGTEHEVVEEIKKIGIIGAGTMGAAIAAHLANVGIPSYLLDIVPRELTPKEEKKGLTLDHPAVRNRIVNEGLGRCIKARPANFYVKDNVALITTGNLEEA